MNRLLALDWFVIPTVAIMVFVVVYLWADRVVIWLHNRSLGQREEVLRLMELMFVETDRKRVTLMMVTSSFGLGTLFFIVFWPNIIPGFVFGAFITIVMWSVPKFIVQVMWEKRCSTFVDQMVDGMTFLANGVKSGLSVQQGMERVQENMNGPISQEFGLVLSQMRLGRSQGEALNELAIRIPRPDVQMFVTGANILSETGGNMAETFATITYTIRERQKIEKKIDAMTAQGVMQGVIVTAIPFVLLAVFAVVDFNYVRPLFSTTLGVIALMIMLSLQIAGGLLIRKLVKVNV